MMMKSVVGFAGLVLASAAGCSVATDGAESSGLAEESLSGCHDSGTRFYVPAPNPDAKDQIKDLKKHHQKKDAELIQKMIETPQAVWLTQPSPKDVKKATRKVMKDAADQHATPVLVPYNIPFRDCAQFSAGGATTKQEYFDWIDAVAKGIGDGDAIVILEPDSLGIIPFYNPFADRDNWLEDPNALEWCQPAEADAATAAADRFEMLSYAVDALKANPGTKVYLDGTHNQWLGAGDAADRLLQANVDAADGFFLNASNYQDEAYLDHYGKWIAECAWFASGTSGSWGAGHAEWCNSQYYPANPNDISTWGLTDQWYTDNVESQTWVPYPGDAGIKHFVVDTSRNAVGPWAATPEQQALGDDQDWCNPPDRGVGLRPTSETGNAVIDAYLWIKIPGESDGQCNRWEPSGSPDPVRGMMDPAAGIWFPEMALELAKNAKPAL
ncbi:MAG TPA: glycoside hydrolase family 6 protein [Polyangiaceae bacterium]|nr:glycoside hydrolase family 6 protein [Polyangiaceae bacterium]